MRSVLWMLILLAFLLYTYGTFEEIRWHKYQTPLSLDAAFVLMTLVACVGVSIL